MPSRVTKQAPIALSSKSAALQITPVTHSSPIPAYVQVEQDLRRLSRSGSSMRIPSEQNLSRLYGVSRVTVRQALERLAANGLVKREHGRGTTIVATADVALDLSLSRSATEQLREAGHKASIKILRRALLAPPRDVAAALNVGTAEKTVVLRRLITVNDTPLCVNTSWFNAKLVPGLERKRFEDRSLWAFLKSEYGLTPIKTAGTIDVVESDGTQASPLQLAPATPVLRLVSRSYDRDRRAIEYSVSLWRSTHLRFRFVHPHVTLQSVM